MKLYKYYMRFVQIRQDHTDTFSGVCATIYYRIKCPLPPVRLLAIRGGECIGLSQDTLLSHTKAAHLTGQQHGCYHCSDSGGLILLEEYTPHHSSAVFLG